MERITVPAESVTLSAEELDVYGLRALPEGASKVVVPTSPLTSTSNVNPGDDTTISFEERTVQRVAAIITVSKEMLEDVPVMRAMYDRVAMMVYVRCMTDGMTFASPVRVEQSVSNDSWHIPRRGLGAWLERFRLLKARYETCPVVMVRGEARAA